MGTPRERGDGGERDLIGVQRKAFTLRWADHELHLGERTRIMGVLNVTPDSFSDGGHYFEKEKAVEKGLAMARDGADIIDVGGESTRPYSRNISTGEEMERVIPVIEALGKELKIPISIDTLKAEVARVALRSGASMLNDISSLSFDPQMISVAAETAVPVILMHMQGTPTHMQDNPTYENLIAEMIFFFSNSMDRAVKGGVDRNRIILDPGVGFGKTFDHNLEIINELHGLGFLGRPIVLGTSRKAFLGQILGKQPLERDTGTMATIAAAVINGAHIVRVHNVGMALDTIRVIDSIRGHPKKN